MEKFLELVAPIALLVSAIIAIGVTLNQVKQLEQKIKTKVDSELCESKHSSLMRELDSIQRKLDVIHQSIKSNPGHVRPSDS